MTARKWLPLAVLLAFAAGCSASSSPGHASPSVCGTHEIDHCTEYVATPAVKGKQLYDLWDQDPDAAGRAICTAIGDQQLTAWMHGRYFRWIDADHHCVIQSDSPDTTDARGVSVSPPQFVITVGVYWDTQSPWSSYSIVEGNKATQLAGVPAWLNRSPEFGGQEKDEYTLSTTGKPDQPGVLFVAVEVDRGRGDLGDSPLDLSPLLQRDQIATTYLHDLF